MSTKSPGSAVSNSLPQPPTTMNTVCPAMRGVDTAVDEYSRSLSAGASAASSLQASGTAVVEHVGNTATMVSKLVPSLLVDARSVPAARMV